MATTTVERVRVAVPEMPLVVLAGQPDLSGNQLALQDYMMLGEYVIPVFTSESSFNASVGPEGLGKPIYAIRRDLLAEIATPDTVFLLDPRLTSQLRFTGADLKAALQVPPTGY